MTARYAVSRLAFADPAPELRVLHRDNGPLLWRGGRRLFSLIESSSSPVESRPTKESIQAATSQETLQAAPESSARPAFRLRKRVTNDGCDRSPKRHALDQLL